MYRIDNPTAIAAIPPPGPPGTPGFFTDGNPAAGQEATIVDGWWLNMLQEEVLTVVSAVGMTPDKNSVRQLYDAIRAIAEASNPDLSAYLPLAGGTLANPGNLTVQGVTTLTGLRVNTDIRGVQIEGPNGVDISAPPGSAAAMAMRAPNSSALISYTVQNGSQSYQAGASVIGTYVIDDVSPPNLPGGQTRFRIESNGIVTVLGSLYCATIPTAGIVCQGNTLSRDGGPWTALTVAARIPIAPYLRGLADIRRLDPMIWRYNDDDTTHEGLLADNLAAVMPEAVGTQLIKLQVDDAAETPVQTMNLNGLTYALINAVKQLADRLEVLEGGEPATPLPA